MITRRSRPSAFSFFGLAAACLLSVSSTFTFAQNEPAPKLDEVLADGNERLEQEDYEAALQPFTKIIDSLKESLDPRASQVQVVAYIGRAKAHIGLEEYQEALADFKLAEDLLVGEKNADLLHARGSMYLDLGQQAFGLALPDLQAAYEKDRENSDYLFSLGKAYALLSATMPGAGKEAKDLLTIYIESHADNAEAWRLRGKALSSLLEYDEALADLNRSIELDPEEHETYVALGVMFLQQKELEKSVAALDEAIEKYTPKDEESKLPFADGYLTKANVLEEIGKKSSDPEAQQEAFQRAVVTCDALLALLPDSPEGKGAQMQALFRKGVNQRLQGQFGMAVQSLTGAIDLNPTMSEAYFRRAICFNEMGEERLALGDLEAAQALNFGDPRAFLWEGLTYAQMGEYRNAIRAYNETISASNRYVDAYLNRGLSYFHLEEYESAIDSFNECIRLEPIEAAHYHKRGVCRENLGETEKAIKSYINAIQVNQRYLPAYDRLIPALQAQGRSSLANEYQQRRAALGGP